MTIVAIDLSSIARPIFEAASDLLSVHTSIVQRVRELASAHPSVAICCDSGKSFRKDLDPTYKANRPETPAAYSHQLALAIEVLRADGFPIFSVPGYEADDLIGTLATWGGHGEVPIAHEVLIVSADKDLLQLVSERVQQFRPGIGTAPPKTYDVAAVIEKFDVRPDQMLDYLALVGDTSDNIIGAKKIGAVNAAKLLNTFGNLDDLYSAMDNGGIAVTPAIMASLLEFRSRMPLVRSLLALKTDAPIPFEDIFKPRVPLDVATFGGDDDIAFGMPTLDETMTDSRMPSVEEQELAYTEDRQEVITPPAAAAAPYSAPRGPIPPARSGGDSGQSSLHVHVAPPFTPITHPHLYSAPEQREVLVPNVQKQATSLSVRESFERQLEPQTYLEAKDFASMVFASRLNFGKYGHPAGVLTTILAGRELGLPAMASLRAFHIVEEKPTMAADYIRARVLQSGLVDYFRPVERTTERATFVIKRKGDPEFSMTYTIEDARRAGLVKPSGGWVKTPDDMLVARCSAKLARLVVPEVTFGMYATEEME